MNQTEKAKISAYWLGLASMYGKEITSKGMEIMLEAVSDLNPNSVLNALENWVRVTTQNRHPFPSEIREMINPKIDLRAAANEIARKIDKAVFDFGYVWEGGYFDSNGNRYWLDKKGNRYESFKAAFIAELGEQAWRAVNARGGWAAVAESSNEMEEGMFIAQLRDQVQSQMLLEQKGVDVTKISFEQKERIGEGAKLIDGLEKKLGMPE